MPKTATETDETQVVSRKRQMAAVVTSTTLTVALGLAAQVLISKVADRVSDRINPKNETDE